MEIAPVGVQMTYANANNATQVQHNLNNTVNLQQDFEAMRQKNDAELKQKQVRTKDDAEGGKIKDDPDRRNRQGGYYYRNQKRKQQTEEEPENFAVDPKRGHFLDISL
ncbi:MAG: hypothetical protein IJ685_09525 [Selenomonadaceae bacterium]|nr:hypothetical protein [Selenomonadaceae bacterium]